MLILLGRGVPSFSLLGFLLVFFFPSGLVQREPLFLQEGVPLCPLPITLTQSPLAKPISPLPHHPAGLLSASTRGFGIPLPPPRCQVAVGHDAQDAAGRRAPTSPWHCPRQRPHRGDGRSPSHPWECPSSTGGWRVLPTCLVLCPQNLGAGVLGLLWLIPLLNSGISKRRDVDLWVVAGSLPARCHTPWWHRHRTLHPSPEPAGRPGTFVPVTACFGRDRDGADKSIPQRSRRLMSICPPPPRWVCSKCLSPNPPLGPAVPENRQKVV